VHPRRPEPAAEAPAGTPAAEAPAASSAASATVTILEPAEGAEVAGPSVHVRLTAEGIQIVPAGQLAPGTGHHHLYLDADLTPPESPVPTIPGQVIHLGTGVSDYTFESVAPGPHRLIAVVADGMHVPIQPWVVDTVAFIVK
jgi:pyruvate/2-oxoglutarate dehydrogenase complex dihydrolipoamide acyltransferase (E2) component